MGTSSAASPAAPIELQLRSRWESDVHARAWRATAFAPSVMIALQARSSVVRLVHDASVVDIDRAPPGPMPLSRKQTARRCENGSTRASFFAPRGPIPTESRRSVWRLRAHGRMDAMLTTPSGRSGLWHTLRLVREASLAILLDR
jgi:hypothetical protein